MPYTILHTDSNAGSSFAGIYLQQQYLCEWPCHCSAVWWWLLTMEPLFHFLVTSHMIQGESHSSADRYFVFPATHHSGIAPRSGISTPVACNSPVQRAQYHILGLYISNLHTKLSSLKICDSPPEERHYHILVLQNLHLWPGLELSAL
jgi:hypothetical protein